MRHEASTRQAAKMDTPKGLHKGICSCGWESQGVESNPFQALRSARQHVEAKILQEIAEAQAACTATPTEIIQAARTILGDHHDFSAVGWESGTTVLVVYTGDNGGVVMRYSLSADLTEVLKSERVRRK